MAHLAVALLGTYQAHLDGKLLTAFETDKARALLAYLMVEADLLHRREALAALFWPDQPESAARNNLRQTLYRLRQVISDPGAAASYLLVTVNEVRFNSQSDHWLDVDEFTLLSAEAQAHHPQSISLCDQCVQRLRAAIGLYKGDFMSGFSLSNASQFDWWLLKKQEEYHRTALRALTRLGRYYELVGDFLMAEEYAQKEIELEPWREAAYRRRMRALALSGQRTAALREYLICERVLERDLGVEPSLETKRLYELIRKGTFFRIRTRGANEPASGGSETPSSPEPEQAAPDIPLVAREAELVKLNQALKLAVSGQGRLVFIRGEAGSGKTRLMGDFIRQAISAHPELLFAWGRCNAHAGNGDSYLPFREILRAFLGQTITDRPADHFAETYVLRLQKALPWMMRVLFEHGQELVDSLLSYTALESLLQDEPNVPEGGSEREPQPRHPGTGELPTRPLRDRSRLYASQADEADLVRAAIFDQMTLYLHTLAKRFPLVLVFDNLQWVDVNSANLFYHLVHRLENSRILILAAFRPEGVTRAGALQRHPLDALINELKSVYGDIQVDLDSCDGRRFVDALLDAEPNRFDRDFRQALYTSTGGHPLLTVELLLSWKERDMLILDQHGEWVPGPDLDWEHLPPRVEAFITERIHRAAPELQEYLQTASVQGVTFIAEVVAAVLGENEGEVIHRLSSGLSPGQNLLVAQGIGQLGDRDISVYRFRNLIYQRYLYRSLDAVKRTRLHQATAEVMEAFYGEKVGSIPPIA